MIQNSFASLFSDLAASEKQKLLSLDESTPLAESENLPANQTANLTIAYAPGYRLTDFSFELPDELIAKAPAAQRSGSRLLTPNFTNADFFGTPENLVPAGLHKLAQPEYFAEGQAQAAKNSASPRTPLAQIFAQREQFLAQGADAGTNPEPKQARFLNLQFPEILEQIPANALLVRNNTRVIPARCFAKKPSGGNVEVMLERMGRHGDDSIFLALSRANRSPKLGDILIVGEDQLGPTSLDKALLDKITQENRQLVDKLTAQGASQDECQAQILRKLDDDYCRVFGCEQNVLPTPEQARQLKLGSNFLIVCLGRAGEFFWYKLWNRSSLMDFFSSVGHIPLPPYMARLDTESDRERYQTVYAKQPGAVAAPTAGLHFTPELNEQLAAKGVEVAEVTLHVGAGTFLPCKEAHPARHRMHAEYVTIEQETVDKLNQALLAGRPIIAVGTTSVRSLEALAQRTLNHTLFSDGYYRFDVEAALAGKGAGTTESGLAESGQESKDSPAYVHLKAVSTAINQRILAFVDQQEPQRIVRFVEQLQKYLDADFVTYSAQALLSYQQQLAAVDGDFSELKSLPYWPGNHPTKVWNTCFYELFYQAYQLFVSHNPEIKAQWDATKTTPASSARRGFDYMWTGEPVVVKEGEVSFSDALDADFSQFVYEFVNFNSYINEDLSVVSKFLVDNPAPTLKPDYERTLFGAQLTGTQVNQTKVNHLKVNQTEKSTAAQARPATNSAVQDTPATNSAVQDTPATNSAVQDTPATNSAVASGLLTPFRGYTNIFIYPGRKLHLVDAVITNFHLPESTLIMLVAAFIGHEATLQMYQHAISQRYRFFSYGDSNFIPYLASHTEQNLLGL